MVLKALHIKLQSVLNFITGAFQVKFYSDSVIKGVLSFFRTILQEHGIYLADYNPNLSIGKANDKQKKYYSYHDLLFVKKL